MIYSACMRSLEALRIKQGRDEQHSRLVNYGDLAAEQFFEEAANLLKKATPIVLEDIIPNLERFSGRWNPGGFMVFPLGLMEGLGSLRLHVWPAGLTRQTAHGPDIHNHAWHLISKVLSGHYSDTLYGIEQEKTVNPDNRNDKNGLLRVFKTRLNFDGKDILISDGTSVKPIPIEKRSISAGKIHTIKAGDHHLTTIPPEECTATLVLDSPAFQETTDVIFESIAIHIARKRQLVDRSSAILAKKQIIKTLTTQVFSH